MTEEIIKRIDAHYKHAIEKHPHFADAILAPETEVFVADELEQARSIIKKQAKLGQTNAEDLLMCEVLEIWEAVAAEQSVLAEEECLDAIAVLLRIIDKLNERK